MSVFQQVRKLTIPLRPGMRTAFALVPLVIALYFALQYPLVPNAYRLTDQGKLVDYSWWSFSLFTGGLVIWFGWYVVAIADIRAGRWTPHWSIIGGLTCVLLATFSLMYPTNAIDVYIYTVRSYIWTHWGMNPNATMPEQLWDVDGFVRFSSKQWADDVSPYGPLWNQLAAPITALTDGHMVPSLIGFKLLSVVAVVVSAILIYRLVAIRAADRSLAAALSWLWNPLVLWEGIGNAHNDVVMMAFVLGALLAWERKRLGWELPLLIGAALIKYVALIFVPVAIVAVARRSTSRREASNTLAFAAITSVAVTLASMVPFFDIPALVDSARAQGARFSNSPGFLVVRTARLLGYNGDIGRTVQAIALLLMLVALGVCVRRVWREPLDMSRLWTELAFVLLVVGTLSFRPWYVIWLIALTSVQDAPGPRRRTLTWSVTALIGYGYSIWIRRVWPFGTYAFDVGGVAFGLMPVLIALGLEVRTQRERKAAPKIG